MRVDFFICGVQKGGTTALDSFLRAHPDIQMARPKETHFFDNEKMRWANPDYARLHGFFEPRRPRPLRGEATPIYSYWPRALERLQRYNPEAKLILMLRHPVLRAWSHWRMETARGWETLPFAEAIRPAARERVSTAPRGAHRVHSYVERGFYAGQVARLLDLFPAEQLLFLRTDALWNEPAATLAKVHAFLGVPGTGEAEQRYVAPRVSGEDDRSATLDPADAAYLADLFAEDIVETARLTGLDLRDWLGVPSSDPMRP
ncbi:hypothetical protein RHAL1_02506 [Beijerinckiaceae bacterium RH AL1]|nr:sulfotransferase [Beijerinckiaceae bacterium]VVB46842.1 hypothetical protein RHCH11_RHCH11_02451 [Beijerinckiaceae bacterium RH CH11]VVB46925.1 hypothetical protein RHAL8_02447 [Beijerinckiaceae bacterium RH AL8]VVC55586.1 hypothetical protein RHAL1_02506 [Beijerinckiaceae bacterium RH AL1]